MAGVLEIQSFQEDALSNHFLLSIPSFPGVSDIYQTNLRVITIDLPEKVIETYEIIHGGRKMTRPSGISGTSNQFSFTYRADKYMDVYKGFCQWAEYVHDSQTGLSLGDAVPLVGGPSLIRVPIKVSTAEADKVPNGTEWTFNGCYITSHGGLTFDENSGDPIEVSGTMDFIDVVWPTP